MTRGAAFSKQAVTVCLLATLVVSTTQAQVRSYPIVYLHPKVTWGTYADAAQKQIYHGTIELLYMPTWSSSWSFLYRGTGLDYHDGFGYRQNQLGGSMVQLIALGNNFLSTRVDLTYINSNSSLTENNTTLYGEVGYGISGGWLGGTVGGYWSDFADERTVGGSLLWWLKLGELTTASVRVNADRFSGTYRDAESFYSAKAALSSLISNRVGFLVAGTAGRRSLFYEQDIKLVYNTLDVLTREVSTTMFLYPAVGTTMLIDVTFDRFEAFNGGTYRVVYLTTGVSFVL